MDIHGYFLPRTFEASERAAFRMKVAIGTLAPSIPATCASHACLISFFWSLVIRTKVAVSVLRLGCGRFFGTKRI